MSRLTGVSSYVQWGYVYVSGKEYMNTLLEYYHASVIIDL